MALTVTRSGDWQSVYGHWRKSHVQIAFDSSYPTGGEALAPSDFGLRVIDMILIEPKNGFEFEYDYTNSLVKVFRAQSSGTFNVDMSALNTIGTGEDDLISYTLPANVLSTNGMGVRMTAWGTTASNTNQKVLRSYYGGASTAAAFLHTALANQWKVVAEVVRTGAATQDCFTTIFSASTASTSVGMPTVRTLASSLTVTNSATAVIKLTGTATTDSDIVQEGQIVEVFGPTNAGAVGLEVGNGESLASLTGVRAIAWGY